MVARTSTSDRFDERASGLLSSAFGIACVVALVGLAANVALGLWTRTTVDSVAYDAARHVASTPDDEDIEARSAVAVERARQTLGPFGRTVTFDFQELGQHGVVTLRVVAPGTALLPRLFTGGPTVGGVDRRIVVYRERP